MNVPHTETFRTPLGKLSQSRGGGFSGKSAAKKFAQERADKARRIAAGAAADAAAQKSREAASKEMAARREEAGAQQIQEMHGVGTHETTGAYVSWAQKQEANAAKEHAAKMAARTKKANATRAENAAKKRVQALGYNDTHKETLGRGSYVGVETFLKNEASNQARAEWRKKNRPRVVKPGKSPTVATSANMVPAPTASPAKNPNLSKQQL